MTTTLANTLYVSTDKSFLSKEHETIVIHVDRERRGQIPMLAVGSVVCFGRVTVSPELMGALAARGISVSFFGYSGKFLARVEGVPSGNVLLRRAQHRAADNVQSSLALARSFVIGKIVNARRFLLHAARDASRQEATSKLRETSVYLASLLKELGAVDHLDKIRGLEGAAAEAYFGCFQSLIKRSEDEFLFLGRSRRPPRDRINALLSFGYTLLHADCAGASCGVGLDPAVGFLHEDRPGRLGLALDLMEELRVPVVDRLVVHLINTGEIAAHDLQEDAAGGWKLTDSGRKTFLTAYQKAKQEKIHHSFLEQETTWALVPHLQARLLARCLRQDLDAYPPFEVHG